MDTGIVARLDALEKAIAVLRNQITQLERRIGGPAGALPAPGAPSQANPLAFVDETAEVTDEAWRSLAAAMPELPFSEAPVVSTTIPAAPAASTPPELDPSRLEKGPRERR